MRIGRGLTRAQRMQACCFVTLHEQRVAPAGAPGSVFTEAVDNSGSDAAGGSVTGFAASQLPSQLPSQFVPVRTVCSVRRSHS